MIILGLGAVLRARSWPYVVVGLLDEPCHLATGALLLGAFAGCRPVPPRFAVATMAASVLLDLDHLPMALGWTWLSRGTPRPYSHSALTVGVLLLAAAALHRMRAGAVVLGAALGVAGHLLRDLATPAVSLWWPWSLQPVWIPYPAYLVVLGVAGLVALLGPRAVRSRAGAPL